MQIIFFTEIHKDKPLSKWSEKKKYSAQMQNMAHKIFLTTAIYAFAQKKKIQYYKKRQKYLVFIIYKNNTEFHHKIISSSVNKWNDTINHIYMC